MPWCPTHEPKGRQRREITVGPDGKRTLTVTPMEPEEWEAIVAGFWARAEDRQRVGR
jgi:hypothetical protein